MHLKKPSFHRTDFSPSWTHKSDSLPNFGVNRGQASRGEQSSPTTRRLPDKASRLNFNAPRRTTTCDGTCQPPSTVTFFSSPFTPPLVTIKGRGGQRLQGLDLHRIELHLKVLGLYTLSRLACNPYYKHS
jgi:hypothetical protein